MQMVVGVLCLTERTDDASPTRQRDVLVWEHEDTSLSLIVARPTALEELDLLIPGIDNAYDLKCISQVVATSLC